MKKYSFQTQLSDGERYRLTLIILLNSPRIRRLLTVLLMPLLIGFVLLFPSLFRSNESGGSINILPVFIFPILVLLILFVLPYPIIKMRKTSDPAYEFDDWGMTLTNKDKTLNIPWRDLSEYIETGKHILLRQNNSELVVHIIPKKVFTDNQELKGFIDYLSQQRLKRK